MRLDVMLLLLGEAGRDGELIIVTCSRRSCFPMSRARSRGVVLMDGCGRLMMIVLL